MSDDLTQQTDGFDDLTQQTSGKLEFGQQSYQPGKPHGASQVSDDFTQQTDGFDDLTQQTSGKLEFGQESQQTYQPWKPHSANQKLDDFTQQTDGFDDLTQQTSGKFELGQQTQQSYQPWKPSSNHESQDFTQQTGGFDDFAQQSSGKLEFGQESQQSYQPWKPNLSQGPSDTSLQGPVSRVPMPAGKPKPRKPNSSLRPAGNVQVPNQNIQYTSNQKPMNLHGENTDASHVYEVPPVIDIDADTVTKRSETRRGDQNVESTTSEYYPAKFNPQTVGSGYDVEGGNLDPVNLLHKSNDATVGLQWHYTYHPSDYRHFVQQTDQKDKEELPRSTQRNLNEGTPNEYTVIDLHQQSPNYVVTPGVKSGKRKFSHIQKQNKLISDQQISDVGTGVAEPKLEPRILQVYGGGQYNPNHNDDIYSGVTVNPSATFAPNSNMDLWDIREKLDRVTVTTTTTTTSTTTESTPPLPVEPIDVSDNIDNSQPTPFWSRVGHKVTTTFDKAKEKFKNIFG
ncbi:unnamed protein product [Xylocopa violacea]|uniref:Uncharacterized protein n=1 Tax=Xylocopa violacea TaxID=135666 RepID=A0ABP1NYM2_XYLVO